MKKATSNKGFMIELPKQFFKKAKLKEGDWLLVRLLNGKEVVLEKPKKDYWDEIFAWGKKFAREQKIKPVDVLDTVDKIRSRK